MMTRHASHIMTTRMADVPPRAFPNPELQEVFEFLVDLFDRSQITDWAQDQEFMPEAFEVVGWLEEDVGRWL